MSQVFPDHEFAVPPVRGTAKLARRRVLVLRVLLDLRAFLKLRALADFLAFDFDLLAMGHSSNWYVSYC
jgi:hypothetical protein